MRLLPGHIVDRKYRVVRLLGEGGMGEVYEGEHLRIKRRVAIKVLNPSAREKSINVQRFEREAQAAGRIGSDHICEVLDFGQLDDGSHFMVMEFLDGQSLGQRFAIHGRMPPELLLPIIAELLEGLASAHQAGIVHRDLKPDNVFLLKDKGGVADFVKILDFGVSKFQPIGPESMDFTRTGAVVGTPYYMSPEAAKGGKEVDSRSDLYSVGVIAFKGLSGQVPFTADTFNELMFRVVLEDAPPIQELVPSLDETVSSIVRKAMSRDIRQRYQTANDMQADIANWLDSRGIVMVQRRLSTGPDVSGSQPVAPVNVVIADPSTANVDLPVRSLTTPGGDIGPSVSDEVTVDREASTSGGRPRARQITELLPESHTTGDLATAPGVTTSPFANNSRRAIGIGAAMLIVGLVAGVMLSRVGSSEPTPAAAPPDPITIPPADPDPMPMPPEDRPAATVSATASATASASASPSTATKPVPAPKASRPRPKPSTRPTGRRIRRSLD